MDRTADDLYHKETAVSNHTLGNLWRIANGLSAIFSVLERDSWQEDEGKPISDYERGGLISAVGILADEVNSIAEHYQMEGLVGHGQAAISLPAEPAKRLKK